ncbi:unnamed protein product, partial [Adineta steineri]
MSLPALPSLLVHDDLPVYSVIQVQRHKVKKLTSDLSDNTSKFHKQSSLIPQVSTNSNDNHQHHEKAFDTDDQDIKLIKQTNTIKDEQTKKLNMMVDDTNLMDKFVQQNPIVSQIHTNSPSTRSSETNEILIRPTSVSLKDLLSYQDVMKAIEREFHLHDGQEREIIMKLWLKGQAMISILQRFRHLFQDLSIDDKDFVEGIKQIREIINYAERDVHYLREQTTMLENQNHFLESEFQRQLEKTVHEKNEQISRLIHIIDQSCSSPHEYKEHMNDENHLSGTEELLKKSKQENIELQREIESLRAKLEYTFTLVNDKLDQQHTDVDPSSTSMIKTTFEQLRQTEQDLQELKLKSASQQEENDCLKYLLEKSQRTDIEQAQIHSSIEQRTLEREIDRVRHELELTEKKAIQLEQRFETSDETVQFHMEKLKLKCDILRKHVLACTQRLDEYNDHIQIELKNEKQILKNRNQQEDSNNQNKIIQLENDLLTLRERYNEMLEHANTLKTELNNVRKQLQEKEKFETNVNTDFEQERQRAGVLENELKFLKVKYDDACGRINTGSQQLEHLQTAFEQASRRCEKLEEEKIQIDAESKSLAKNVANVTAKYKNKLHTVKSRLEQTERERREIQNSSDQFQYELERLKNELIYNKETIFEKEK